MVGAFAVSSNSPLAFITHPVASTMGFGVAVVDLMVTGGLLAFSGAGIKNNQIS
ncbi:hypothetical protein [uncultured Nostoc sp.]|uniref:hypothetical protein n=1 Tax=uncultured Nostoc sp. TaxID=340711 RepID=UPI0035CAABC0